MRWLGRPWRSRRSPDPGPVAVEVVRAPAGIDHLLATAARTEPKPPHLNDASAEAEPPETNAPASWESLNDAAEEVQKRGDWAVAEPLWRSLRRAYPHVWFSYTAGATALAGLGRFDEALRVLTEASHRFPREPTIRHEIARLAARQGNWPVAESQWRIALGFDVREEWVYAGLAEALKQQGREAEAATVLSDMAEQEPIARFLYPTRMIETRVQWRTRLAHWGKAYQRFGGSENLSHGLARALLQLAEHEPVSADMAHRDLGLAAALAATVDDRHALTRRFESLGGLGPAGGCEFGTFQRQYGDDESLGLFRWAAISPESLIACLQNRFDGIGSSDTTTIYWHEDDTEALWQIGDTRYGTAMHSFVPSAEVPYDQMMVRARNRMRYLKNKLITDLEKPEKIFVLNVGYRHLLVTEIAEFSRTIRSYGPGELLCVCPADSTHPAGYVVPAAPGVFVGYIDFSGRLNETERRIEWALLCWSILGMSDILITE